MIADFIRTVKNLFSWITTVLPQGIKLMLKVLALAVIFCVLGLFFLDFIFMPLSSICLIFCIFVLFFCRDPKREIPFNENEITAPADGTILSIKTEDDPNTIVIRIFLSIFNVHIQRAPYNGEVTETKYTKGTFLFANNPGADKNERNLIAFKTAKGDIAMEQITGAIARRIECWVNKDDVVKTGQKVGFIYFGSQVALYLPKDKITLTVKEGQAVQGGLTVMGLWR